MGAFRARHSPTEMGGGQLYCFVTNLTKPFPGPFATLEQILSVLFVDYLCVYFPHSK